MSDQTPQNHGNERAGIDAAPDVELDPAIERELRAMSAWDGETPKPSLAARALAEHDEEMREVRARRSWSRQGGLMAAAVAIAGLGLSIGLVSTNKPVERMKWSVMAHGDAPARQPIAERAGLEDGRARAEKRVDVAGDTAGASQQSATDQMQGQARQMKAGGPARQSEPATTAAPAPSAAPTTAPPAAPAGVSADPKAAESAASGATDANKGSGATDQGGDTAKKSEPESGKAEAAGKGPAGSWPGLEALRDAGRGNSDSTVNVNVNVIDGDGVTNVRRFGSIEDVPVGASPVVRPTGGLGGMRGEMVKPGVAEWAAYVGRSMLLGMPWILLGLALVAIAWIRMRR